MNAKLQNILITGGSGFIGGHLAHTLMNRGYAVTVLDLQDPKIRHNNVEYIKGDVRKPGLVLSLLKPNTAVFHFAATVSVPLCQHDPQESYSNNFTSTLVVLEAIRSFSQKNNQSPCPLVFASTAALYGNNGQLGVSLSESNVAERSLSFYAAQKFASEHAIQLYSDFHKIPATIFRFFNVYGPNQDPSSPYSGVISRFMDLALQDKDLPLNAGGLQTRDFISVHDIVNACCLALSKDCSTWNAKPMNLGTSRSITVKELAQLIIEVTKTKAQTTTAPAREGDVLHSCANTSRAKEQIGFEAKTELKAGLQELANYLRKN